MSASIVVRPSTVDDVPAMQAVSVAAAERFRAYIAEQTLATELTFGPAPAADGFSSHTTEMSGESLRVALRRARSGLE